MIVIDEIMVCSDCFMIIASDDSTGIENERMEKYIRDCVQDLGPYAHAGDFDKREEFSHTDCECCGALPGERHHVVIFGKEK